MRKREKGTGAAYAIDVIYSLLIIVSSRTCANTFRSFHSAFVVVVVVVPKLPAKRV